VARQVVRFKSYDSLPIPGLLYQPHQTSPAARAPAIVMVQGGPGDQARVGCVALTQALVNHGYVVFDINNRGSSGYGKTSTPWTIGSTARPIWAMSSPANACWSRPATWIRRRDQGIHAGAGVPGHASAGNANGGSNPDPGRDGQLAHRPPRQSRAVVPADRMPVVE
jgi:hypothetical protein